MGRDRNTERQMDRQTGIDVTLERDMDWLPPACTQTRNQICNLGMCHYVVYRATFQQTEPGQPGPDCSWYSLLGCLCHHSPACSISLTVPKYVANNPKGTPVVLGLIRKMLWGDVALGHADIHERAYIPRSAYGFLFGSLVANIKENKQTKKKLPKCWRLAPGSNSGKILTFSELRFLELWPLSKEEVPLKIFHTLEKSLRK